MAYFSYNVSSYKSLTGLGRMDQIDGGCTQECGCNDDVMAHIKNTYVAWFYYPVHAIEHTKTKQDILRSHVGNVLVADCC